MTVDPQRLLALQMPEHECAWTQRDCQLYALATGFGQDPVDERELRYVLEGPGFRREPDRRHHAVLRRSLDARERRQPGHVAARRAAQRLPPPHPARRPRRAFRRVSPASSTRVRAGAWWSSASRYCATRRRASRSRPTSSRTSHVPTAASASRAVPRRSLTHCRIGRPTPASWANAPGTGAAVPALRRSQSAPRGSRRPRRPPVFRDPSCMACAAMGLRHGPSCRLPAVTTRQRLRGIGARISAPVYPGDVLRTEIWLDDDDAASASDSNTRIVSFRMTVPARDGVVVLNNGRAEIAPGA